MMETVVVELPTGNLKNCDDRKWVCGVQLKRIKQMST